MRRWAIRPWRWFLRAIDTAGRVQASAALGLVGLAGVVIVAVLNAVFELGSPWGYVVFVSFVLVGYAAFLAVVERVCRAFPDHDVEVGRPWYGDFPDAFNPGREVRLIFLHVRYTNRERTERANLQIDLLWRREVQGQVMGPYKVSHYSRVSLSDVLEMPLHVDPQRTQPGHLAFEPHEDWVFDYGPLTEVWIHDHHRVSLRITDHVSGTTIECEVPPHPRENSKGIDP
jgi:hypothetical protein